MRLQNKILVMLMILSNYNIAQTNIIYQWAKGIGGISFDQGNSTVLDQLGNVYITGYFSNNVDFDPGIGTAILNSGGTYDIFIAKYDANGNYLWAKSIGGVSDDKANSIAIDGLGNIYITGKFSYSVDFDPGPGISVLNSPGGWGMFFAKFDSNGNYLWAKSVGNTNDIDGTKIVVDASGNSIVTGYKWASMDFDPGVGITILSQIGTIDAYFAKYDNNGSFLWAKSIGASGNSYACGNAITCDALNNIYIGGYFTTTTDFDPGIGTATLSSVNGADIFFGKYDSNGNYIWAKSIGSGNDDYIKGLAVDNSANVIIIGAFRGPADFDPSAASVILNTTSANIDDIFLAKYNSNGNFIWANSMGGVGTDWGTTIKVDGLGQIYIAGTVSGVADLDPGTASSLLYSNGAMDIFFAMYDGMGNHIWSNNVGSTTNDFCSDIVVDINGSVFITGSFSGSTDFDPSSSVANVNWYASDDIFIAKYTPSPLKINYSTKLNSTFSVDPNPNNGIFQIFSEEEAELTLLNSLGEKVFMSSLNKGINKIEAKHLPAGIYNLILSDKLSEIKTAKIIVQ